MEGPEITCWPNERHHYRLTTGREYQRMGAPEPVSLTETEKQMCAILGLNELELGIFLREWASAPGVKPREELDVRTLGSLWVSAGKIEKREALSARERQGKENQ